MSAPPNPPAAPVVSLTSPVLDASITLPAPPSPPAAAPVPDPPAPPTAAPVPTPASTPAVPPAATPTPVTAPLASAPPSPPAAPAAPASTPVAPVTEPPAPAPSVPVAPTVVIAEVSGDAAKPVAISVVKPEAEAPKPAPPAPSAAPAPASPASVVMVEHLEPVKEATPLPPPVVAKALEAPASTLAAPIVVNLVKPEEVVKAAEKPAEKPVVAPAPLEIVNVMQPEAKPAEIPVAKVVEPTKDAVAPQPPVQIVTVKADDAVKVIPVPATNADEPIEIVSVPTKPDEPVKVIKVPALKADEPLKVISIPAKVEEPAKVVSIPAKVDEPLKVVEVPATAGPPAKAVEPVIATALPQAPKKLPTIVVSPTPTVPKTTVVTQPLTPTIILTKPDAISTNPPAVQNVGKAPEPPKPKYQFIPHEVEPMIVDISENIKPRARLSWRERARARLHKAGMWLKHPGYDRPQHHERPRRRDRVRAKLFTDSSFSFLLGRKQGPMMTPVVVEAAQTPRGPYEHHTTHGVRAMQRSLITKLHERRQRKHHEAAELHKTFSIRAKADGFMEVAAHHIARAEHHARKEVDNAEKSVRGRKRHVEEEVHAAEKHLADKHRHDERYLNAQIGHISAQLHHKHIGEIEKKKAEDHLRAAKINLEAKKDQLDKEGRARHAAKIAEKDFSVTKSNAEKDLGNATKKVRLPSAEVEVRVGTQYDGSMELGVDRTGDSTTTPNPHHFTNRSLEFVSDNRPGYLRQATSAASLSLSTRPLATRSSHRRMNTSNADKRDSIPDMRGRSSSDEHKISAHALNEYLANGNFVHPSREPSSIDIVHTKHESALRRFFKKIAHALHLRRRSRTDAILL